MHRAVIALLADQRLGGRPRIPPPSGCAGAPAFNTLTLKQSSTLTLRPAPAVESLFNSCRMPQMGIDEEAYEDAAKQLKVDVAAIKAVANVETKGSAFDKEGRPTILYERHYFHRLTQGKFSKKNPDISNSASGGYGKFSAQYGKLEKAYKLAPDAALMSASWGRFQIMGANHVSAGYTTAQAVRDGTHGLGEQPPQGFREPSEQ